MTESRRTTLLTVALAVLLVPAALRPIASYDFFWHRATGRWIVENRALPAMDPFAVASDRKPWINGEWLFQVVLHAVGSIEASSWIRAIAVAILFAAMFGVTSRRSGPALALLITSIAFAGAWDRLDVRPSTAAAFLLAGGIALLLRGGRSSDVGYVVLTIIWINTHPSAVIAPLLALFARRFHWLPVASGLALLINPFGIHGVLAPISLTLFARSGEFVNAEWLPSDPRLFPLLYLTVIGGAFCFWLDRRNIWRVAAFAFLAYLAIAHVRNQGLYFAALPLLVAPSTDGRVRRRVITLGCSLVAAIAIVWVLLQPEHRAGIAERRFPIASVERLMRSGLQGNIYNPDQFGGYLIHETYPERRTLTDGRNELYHDYIREYAAARLDSRKWRALLERHRIDLAVDEYRPLLDTVNPRTGEHTMAPASLAYWPRREWALIAFDDVSMVFARRRAFRAELLEKLEIKGVVPDAGSSRQAAN